MLHFLSIAVLSLCYVLSAQADIYSANHALSQGNYETAVKEFTKLAEKGDANAEASLGYMYYAGEGVTQDYEKAVYWYRKAAVQGNRDAQYNLAVCYAFGKGTKQDLTEAASWYRRAGEQDHVISQYSLGISYAYGEGVSQDAKKAVHWLKKAADQGYAKAQVQLGSMYRTGDGVKQNYSEAAHWYRLAAAQGDAAAQNELANLKRSTATKVATRTIKAKPKLPIVKEKISEPTPTKKEAALKTPVYPEKLKKAERAALEETKVDEAIEPEVDTVSDQKDTAKKSSGGLFSAIGHFFSGKKATDKAAVNETITTTEDVVIAKAEEATPAIEDIKLAEKAETDLNQYSIQAGRRALTNGDYEDAYKQFQALAKAGDSQAQSYLGLLYYVGKGVPKDMKLAYHWYKKSAEQGNVDAQYSIGNMYLLGEGVEQSNAAATKWYSLASKQGHTAAKNNIKRLEKINALAAEEKIKEVTQIDEQIIRPENLFDTEKENPELLGLSDVLFIKEIEPENVTEYISETHVIEEKQTTMAANENKKKSASFFGFLGGIFSSEKDKNKKEEVALPEDNTLQTTSDIDKMSANERIEKSIERSNVESLRSQATRGDQDAQYKLGTLYYSGNEVKQDYSQAALWYQRAAEQGNVDAQYSLGNMFLLGEGVVQDDNQATHWYALAAKQGHISAQYNLNNLRKTRKTISQQTDHNAALISLNDKRASTTINDKISGKAIYKQGLAYAFGDGVPKNERTAFTLFYEAAEKGYVLAQYKVGVAFAYGEGVRQDMKKAVEFYRKAAEQGHTIAQRNLATMYLNGNGVEQNKVRAFAWCQILANAGNAMDLRRRDMLKKELSEEELIESRQLAEQISRQIINASL